jgi:addiction module HigA family antidote
VGRLPNIHPGDVLREDYLVPLAMSAQRLATGLGMRETVVGEILQGKRPISPATALRLERFFGASADFWLNLQAAYDLEEERERLSTLPAEIPGSANTEEYRQELAQRREQAAAALTVERRHLAKELDQIQPLERDSEPEPVR